MIRFLADENVPLASVRRLRNEGYDVTSIAEDAPGSRDPDVLARADRERRVLITFDRDFGKLLYQHPTQYKQLFGVIYLRFHPPATPIEAAERILAVVQTSYIPIQGTYLTVERGQVRHRPLP